MSTIIKVIFSILGITLGASVYGLFHVAGHVLGDPTLHITQDDLDEIMREER